MSVPGQSLQLSLIFASKGRAYPSEARLKCFTLGEAPVLAQNIRLDW